jgi:hypothetical protein
MAFVKIDKEILNSYCFANPNHLKIWIWLLVKANFKTAFFPLKIGKGTITVKVERGQLIFGRFKAEEELSLDGSLIYRVLKSFEEQEQIKIESNNQYSIITICKYDTYQNNLGKDEQPTKNRRTTDKQQTNNQRVADESDTNTYKEEKEGIEEKEELEYKESKEDVELPFNGEVFKSIWLKWIEYKKKEHRFSYKTKESQQAALRELVNLSGGNEQTAIEIIGQSMANGWKGFFGLKKAKNNNNGNSDLESRVQEEFNKRFGK